jgi:sulfate adenylyltransferase
MVDNKLATKLRSQSVDWPSFNLTKRQICDLELLLIGGFSPLTSFLNQADYKSVVKNMRLSDGSLWPIPITLDIDKQLASSLKLGQKIALRDQEGFMLAALTLEDIYKPNKITEAKLVYGTVDEKHPAVSYLNHQTKDYYISGKLEGLQLPQHYDFTDMRHTPNELRALFNKKGWTKVVAFQTRNPMHRAHVELTTRAAKSVEANLLIQPSFHASKGL